VIVERWTPTLQRLVRRDFVRPSDADDLVQDAFLHLHRSAADFRAGERLRPWLVTIALNLRREHVRRRFRRPEAQLELDGRSDPAVQQPPVLEERDARRQIDVALAALPAAQREVIELHWFAGLPFAEVAQRVGASVSAVKVRAHRGYERLRTMLKDAG
jgi:RNA polymerase sigma-70 factor (ECF subfamily)